VSLCVFGVRVVRVVEQLKCTEVWHNFGRKKKWVGWKKTGRKEKETILLLVFPFMYTLYEGREVLQKQTNLVWRLAVAVAGGGITAGAVLVVISL